MTVTATSYEDDLGALLVAIVQESFGTEARFTGPVTCAVVTGGRLTARVVADRLADGTWRAASETRGAAAP